MAVGSGRVEVLALEFELVQVVVEGLVFDLRLSSWSTSWISPLFRHLGHFPWAGWSHLATYTFPLTSS